MVAESQTLSVRDFPAYLHFTPRPDQPERFDEQTAFYESKGDGVAWMIGGNGCTIAATPILDPTTGTETQIGSITGPHKVLALNPNTGRLDVADALPPYQKGIAPILAIVLSNGREVHCTAAHNFLSSHGTWVQARKLRVGDALVLPNLSIGDSQSESRSLETSLSLAYPHDQSALLYGQFEDCLHSATSSLNQAAKTGRKCAVHDQSHSQIVQDSQVDYQSLPHCDDEQPHVVLGVFQDAFPSQADALSRIHACLHVDDPDNESEYIHPDEPLCHVGLTTVCVQNEWCNQPLSQVWQACGGQPEELTRLFSGSRHPDTSELLDRLLFACNHPSVWANLNEHQTAIVTEIRTESSQPFYDFEVPGYGNYLACGVIHANSGTTTTLLAKVARFIYETPPPRPDTPFWVIAKSYDQVTKTCWKEKLYGQGHILDKDVDWARVGWYKSKQRLPYSVPLKPNERGNNWMLEFRSYEQGIGAMMAQAIGGFAFVEQFPWGVFEEVLRGCREYNFPGSKLVEYTPVDPDLSIDIEEMIENGPEPEEGKQPGLRYMPKNWKIYHANTMCAMEAGHVDKKWFEEFFGMVPEDMKDVRMLGMFASFEGVVYKEFSTAVHCLTDREIWSRSIGCDQRRGIDWGAGPDNDFVCLWGSRNNLGQWFITDEYVSNDQTRTTVDHLSEVYNRWEWPLDNTRYGVTYCDPADPDNLRIAQKLSQYNPKVENMSIYRGRNAKTEGIEHIKYLLKSQVPVPVHDEKGYPVIDEETGKVKIRMEPKLLIHRTNCPKLIQQMKTYRYLRAPKATRITLNPRDPAAEPIKKNDHCLDALRYMVLTDDIMNKATISSAKSHSDLIAQTNGEYLPSRGLRGFTTQHRNRG